MELSNQPSNLTFTNDLVSWRAQAWKKNYVSLTGKANVRYLEIGTFEGRSLIWMFENVLTDASSTATVVDNFYDKTKATFLSNIEKSGLMARVNLIEGNSQEELRKLPLQSFDLIYIDGSHRAQDVLTDAVLSWGLLKINGLLVFDDYELELDAVTPHQLPKVAIDTFLEIYKGEMQLISRGYEVAVLKTAHGFI